MDREVKFKLMRRFPFLFSRELRKLSLNYDYTYYTDPPENTSSEYTLTDVISAAFDEKFLDRLEKDHCVTFRVDRYTPPALLNNPRYLDYVARRHPYYIVNFPNERITDEHIKLYEDYLTNGNNRVLCYSFPSRLLESQVVFDILIEDVKKEDGSIDRSSFEGLIRSIGNNPDKIVYLFNRLGDSAYSFFDYSLYSSLGEDVKCLPFLIDRLLEKDILNIKYIPQKGQDYVKEWVLNKLYKGEELQVDAGAYYYDNPLFTNGDIFLAILYKELRERLNKDEITLNDIESFSYYHTKFSPLLEMFFTNFKTDMSNISPEEKYIIFAVLRETRHRFPNSFFDDVLMRDQDILTYMVNNSTVADYSTFKGFTVDDDLAIKMFNRIFDKLKGAFNPGYILMPVLDNAYKSEKVLNGVLTRLNSEVSIDNANNYLLFLKRFDINLFKDENLELLLSLSNKNQTIVDDFISHYSHSQELVNSLLELGKIEYLTRFSEDVFNTDTIKIMLKNLSLSDVYNTISNRNSIENAINSLDSGYEKLLESAFNKNDLFVVLSLYKNHSLGKYTSPKFEECIDRLHELIEQSGVSKDVIDKVLSGERKAVNVLYAENPSVVFYINNFGDVTSESERDFLSGYSIQLLEKINKKQLKAILKDLERFPGINAPAVALNMYLAFGYARTKDILNPAEGKNYGTINSDVLKLFENLDTRFTEFQADGKGFKPVINEEFVNVIFGANYKIANTPFRNYLNSYADKKKEIDAKKEKIANDPNIKNEDKRRLNAELDDQFTKYRREVGAFFNNLSSVYSNWDIIYEEFLKEKNNSSLEKKLNVATINSILEVVNLKLNEPPNLEARDEPLRRTDIFRYVGRDPQFSVGDNASKAPQRAIELSRKMEGAKNKKFPHIVFTEGNYTIETFGKKDRDILTMGYKSNCCFRPLCFADGLKGQKGYGSDGSLMSYCCSNEYGGGLKICDSAGKVKMFTPILRNGNVLMLHSIETKGLSPEESIIVHGLLSEYAQRVLQLANEKGDNIDFVVITDLHYFDRNYACGVLAPEKKFRLFDPEGKYSEMYNNLSDTNHMILAKRDGVSQEDIRYDYPIDLSYEAPELDLVVSVSLNDHDEEKFERLDLYKLKYEALAKKRTELLNEGKKEEAYGLSSEMSEAKSKYISHMKEMMSSGIYDKYSSYKVACSTIETVARENGTLIPGNHKRMVAGVGWYIVVTDDGKIIGDSIATDEKDYERYLEFIQDQMPNAPVIRGGLKKEGMPVQPQVEGGKSM